MNLNNSGIVFIDKPPGITSFKTLETIKKSLGTKKVGHTGTLDKFASGLMVVLTGQMTKLANFFNEASKEYEAVFTFGKETTTLDPEGDIVKTSSIPNLSAIEKAISKFIGEIEQYPPSYSAVHVNGQRAYKIALSGNKPDISPRHVVVHSFEILDWDSPSLRARISCSKGTYIRSLAKDIGDESGSCAFVSSLRRTRVGEIGLDRAVKPDNFSIKENLVTGKDIFNFIEDISIVELDDIELVGRIKNGSSVKWEELQIFSGNTSYKALFYNGSFIALVKTDFHSVNYVFVSGEKL